MFARDRISRTATILFCSACVLAGASAAQAHPPDGDTASSGSYRLTVVKAGSGTGTVTGDGIDCGDSCEVTVAGGSVVDLVAAPVAGSYFAGWSGSDCAGTATTCSVAMNSSHTVTAAFEVPTAKTVTLTSNKHRVAKGKAATFTATVSPCSGHEGQVVELRSTGATLATVPTDPTCTASVGIRVNKARSYYAVSPAQDQDHLAGISPDILVRIKRP